MIHNIEAIYDHGVFRPIEPLALPESRTGCACASKRKRATRYPLSGPIIGLPRLSALNQAHNTESIGSLSAKSFMTATIFVDTNVLLYAASNAPADQPKRTVARQLLAEPAIAFSAQVLQEFYSAAVTKQRLQMTHDEAVAVVNSLSAFPVWPISRDLVLEAIEARGSGFKSPTGMLQSLPPQNKWDARPSTAKTSTQFAITTECAVVNPFQSGAATLAP